MLLLISNKYLYNILCFLLHILPAFIMDCLAKITGRTPKYVCENSKWGPRKIHAERTYLYTIFFLFQDNEDVYEIASI